MPWSWNTAVYLVYTAVYPRYTAVYSQYTAVYREYTAVYLPTHFEYTAVYSEVYGRIHIVFVANFNPFCLVFFVRIPPFLPIQVQYDPWPLRSITDYEVAEPEVELVAPKAAAGQVVSGREYGDPTPVGRGGVASAPSDSASTTGKDTGYYFRLNVRASGALYDIRLPIRVVANLKEAVVEAIWGAAVWSKSSGKVRVF